MATPARFLTSTSVPLLLGGGCSSIFHGDLTIDEVITPRSVGEFGGVLEPGWVPAAHVVLRQPLDLLKELHAVAVEAAHELVHLVGDPDGGDQHLDAGLRLEGLRALQVRHSYQRPATAQPPSASMHKVWVTALLQSLIDFSSSSSVTDARRFVGIAVGVRAPEACKPLQVKRVEPTEH